jgi:sigma-E factor negative regulatory protein RseB
MSHLADQLSGLVDGELSGADLDRVNAHLASCADCRAEAAALRQLKRALRALGEPSSEELGGGSSSGMPGGDALTERLLVLAGPGGPVPSRKRRRAQYRASRASTGPEREARRGRVRHLTWSLASLVLMGLGTAAYGLGGVAGSSPVLEMAMSPQLKAMPTDGAPTDAANASDSTGGTARKQTVAMRLLGKAASAGQSTAYTGVELMSDSSMNGDLTTVTQVQHPGIGSPDAVFGLNAAYVTLIGKNYVAMYQGGSVSAGRSALVVELHRTDGSVAARYWLDQKTMLPLRREVFDDGARLVSEDLFIQVSFGAQNVPSLSAQQKEINFQATRTGPLWATVTSPVEFLSTLRRTGWRLPNTVAGGLALYTAAQTSTGRGQEISLCYTDGLFVVSLVAQRGGLASRPAGAPASLNGHMVYVSGHSLTWAAPGFVYTLTADAPPATVAAVMSALPASGSAGFLGRLGHGFDRMAALVSPFS